MWSTKDLEWLAVSYPSIKSKPGGDLEGSLVFRMLFRDGSRYINPTPELLAETGGTFISGTYEVRIEHQNKTSFPNAFEIGGKIQTVATNKGLKPVDLHIFPVDSSLCLASPMAIYLATAEGLSLQRYMEDFLIPYLFAQQYFAKWDSWPWGDLSHSALGHLEWLGRRDHSSLEDARVTLRYIKPGEKGKHYEEFFSNRPRMHKPCICGSGKKFRECHPDVKRGISEIRKLIYSRKIDLADYN